MRYLAVLCCALWLPLSSVAAVPEVFNVKTFGARGDGTADDTEAVRKAIAAAEAVGGGYVYFPSGRYEVSPRYEDATWPKPDTDPNWYSVLCQKQACFQISCDNMNFVGDGPSKSVLSLRTINPQTREPMAIPLENWTVVYPPGIKAGMILRGTAFRLGSKEKDLTAITFRHLRITGNLPGTVNHAVGGEPVTGDGWDQWGKCLSIGTGRTVNVTIEDCMLDRFRGEIVYSGGTPPYDIKVSNTLIEECNASAVAVSGKCTMIGVTLRNVYNGSENYAIGQDQMLVARQCTFEKTRPDRSGTHGLVFQGNIGKGTSCTIDSCTFRGLGRGIYLAAEGENMSITKCQFQQCTSGVFVGAAGGKQFRTLRIADNNLDCAACILLLTYTTSLSDVTIENNTAAGALFLADAATNRLGLTVRGNIVRSDLVYSLEASPVPRGIWTGNLYPGTKLMLYRCKALVDKFDLVTNPAAISPGREYCLVNLVSANPQQLTIGNPSLYPEGYTVEIARWYSYGEKTLISPDANWNSLTSTVELLPGDSVVFCKENGKFKFVEYRKGSVPRG